MGEWTNFRDLASSTGYIFLVVILLWCLLAGIIYWAFVSGSTSMKEEVKFKVVEDDKPVTQ
ncbi:MAG TPA: hypothetical protein VNT75_07525 [Symbiobacteriaceae bacterium]|nr:hypothetical protein [Symbiobacteriaceae bacterium]